MDNPVTESPKIEDEEETVKPENDMETEVVAGSTSTEVSKLHNLQIYKFGIIHKSHLL